MTTILVVEHDDGTRKLLTLLFERAGYMVLSADTGELALRTAQAHRPDVVLVDDLLPDMPYGELCWRLANIPVTHNIPLILHCAASTPPSDAILHDMGAVAAICKPFSPKALHVAVQRVLGAGV